MGNQGTTNWKLTAFFAISLMLIAGLFSNAAIAGNGDGEITVGWAADVANIVANSYEDPTAVTAPLAAGSRGNVLRFTYTVDPADNISMAGGQLTIDIPAGWTIHKQIQDKGSVGSPTPFDETTIFDEVLVTVDGDEIYNSMGEDINSDVDVTANINPALTKASHGEVTIGDPITVTLGSNWFDGGTLVITLGNVQTDIPSSLRVPPTTDYDFNYTAYTFEARSQERNGRLVRLRPSTDNPNPQPRVRVGNIMGTRVLADDATNTDGDTTKRLVAVTPAKSYPGEKHDYIVTFTAPGPMYRAMLAVDLPNVGVLENDEGEDDQISVRAPGVAYTFDPETDIAGDRVVTVNLTRINKDQKVTVTLRQVTVAANVTISTDGADADTDPDSAFAVTTTVGTNSDIDVTTVSGGTFHALAGSGTLAVSPDNAKANAVVSRITVTYTAVTSLMNANLEITVPSGIMASAGTGERVTDADADPPTLGDTFLLQMTDSSKKGYISSPDSKGAAPVLGPNDADLDTGTPTTITWNAVTLAKDKTFRTYITGVRVKDEGDTLPFTAQVTQGTAALAGLADPANFYVIVTENEDVTFGADKHFVRAASLETVTFTFTAVDTPIRNGRVQFSIPSGWTTPVKKDADGTDVLGQTALTAGGDHVKHLTVSGRSITVTVESLAIGSPVTVVYGNSAKKAKVQTRAADVKINGYYWASSSAPRRGAGTVAIEVGNANDGTGKGTITPTAVRAGSIDETFTIKYVAAGTMDGGQISLKPPAGWGEFETDPAQLNYVRVSASRGASIEEIDNGGSIVIVTLDKCPPNGTITFVYGTGTGARRGARAQDATGVASFTIQSQGDDFGTLTGVMGDRAKATVTDDDPDYLGETFSDSDPVGQLRVNVTGADDGSGTGEVTLVASKAGDGAYTDVNGVAVTEMRVHAADDATYVKVVYTATETIENGALKFTAPAGWSKPQGSDPGEVGFTSVQGTGGASIDPEAYADAATDLSLEVPITLINSGDTIEVHYGETAGSGGGAVVPAASGTYRFTVDIKGGDATTNAFRAIRGTVDGDRLEIKVYSQASGGGSAEVTAGDDGLTAGGEGQITVVYTAAGDINNGMLKLTTPANWSHPLMSNVAITSTGSVGSASASDFGGYYVGDPDDATDDKTVPTGGPGAMDVLVDSVRLNAGDKVTFVFSAAMVQAAMGDATFAVTLDGGAGPGMTAAAVSPPEGGTLTVSVGEAAAGSGTSGVDLMGMAVIAGSMANELTFTYTAVGTIGYPREFRVSIPAGWSEPNDEDKGTYTVALTDKDGRTRANVVEALAAVDRDLVARVRAGSATVNAGDVVSITYTNADAPRTPERSAFEVLFDDDQVGDDLIVVVQSEAGATALAVNAPAQLSADDGESVAVTLMLQDDDGNEATLGTDQDVALSSSNSATGSFMVDGEAVTMVTISAGESSAMVYYSDTTAGVATITATAGDLTDTATIVVTTEIVMVDDVDFMIADSDGVAKDVARDGDTITVTALATPGKNPTVTIGSIIPGPGNMDESTDSPGTYTRSHTLAMGTQDATYAVTVNLGDESGSADDMVTVDNTAPTVTVSDIEGMVANGDTVVISAMVDDGDGSGVDSVMADVSMLDSTQGMVTLSMGTDGSYSKAITISEDNTASNGEKSITVTAMDAAGNSSDPVTVMVTLQNSISFTSMVTANLSLFHMPLDDDEIDTVGDLRAALGGDNVTLLAGVFDGNWGFADDDMTIAADLGLLINLREGKEITFTGGAWGEGSAIINLNEGPNLIGLPVNDERINKVSDIMAISGGTVTSIIVLVDGDYDLVASPGDPADGEVAGDVAYLVNASAIAVPIAVTGDGWMNGDAAGAAPIALAGYTVDNQTPALAVHGSVVDEITGLAREGFRVKVKNLETKAALSEVTSAETADGYNMLFVDLVDAHAARVGDVLEITADSPNPLIGVKPVRHIVTVDDVKNSTIQLEELIAYEIPAETELLRNYPNPFNPETWIPYRLAEDANVSLTIYDTSGALVRSIDIGHQTAAVYETRAKAIYWDGRNRFGEQVASGLYFYHLSAGDDFSATRRMVILK